MHAWPGRKRRSGPRQYQKYSSALGAARLCPPRQASVGMENPCAANGATVYSENVTMKSQRNSHQDNVLVVEVARAEIHHNDAALALRALALAVLESDLVLALALLESDLVLALALLESDLVLALALVEVANAAYRRHRPRLLPESGVWLIALIMISRRSARLLFCPP